MEFDFLDAEGTHLEEAWQPTTRVNVLVSERKVSAMEMVRAAEEEGGELKAGEAILTSL